MGKNLLVSENRPRLDKHAANDPPVDHGSAKRYYSTSPPRSQQPAASSHGPVHAAPATGIQATLHLKACPSYLGQVLNASDVETPSRTAHQLLDTVRYGRPGVDTSPRTKKCDAQEQKEGDVVELESTSGDGVRYSLMTRVRPGRRMRNKSTARVDYARGVHEKQS